MSYTSNVSVSQKTSYRRPYKTKTREQRRKDDRKKYDESSDRKFLMRVAGAIAILLAVVVVCMVKGAMDRSEAEAASSIQAVQ